MPAYLIEFFLPRSRTADAQAITARVQRAAAELTSEGTPVSLVQALALSRDELFQCLLDAPSTTAAAALRERAGLPSFAEPELVERVPLPHQPQ